MAKKRTTPTPTESNPAEHTPKETKPTAAKQTAAKATTTAAKATTTAAKATTTVAKAKQTAAKATTTVAKATTTVAKAKQTAAKATTAKATPPTKKTAAKASSPTKKTAAKASSPTKLSKEMKKASYHSTTKKGMQRLTDYALDYGYTEKETEALINRWVHACTLQPTTEKTLSLDMAAFAIKELEHYPPKKKITPQEIAARFDISIHTLQTDAEKAHYLDFFTQHAPHTPKLFTLSNVEPETDISFLPFPIQEIIRHSMRRGQRHIPLLHFPSHLPFGEQPIPVPKNEKQLQEFISQLTTHLATENPFDVDDDDDYFDDDEDGSYYVWDVEDFLSQEDIQRILRKRPARDFAEIFPNMPSFTTTVVTPPPHALEVFSKLKVSSETWIGGSFPTPSFIKSTYQGVEHVMCWFEPKTQEAIALTPIDPTIPDQGIVTSAFYACHSPIKGKKRFPKNLAILEPAWLPAFRESFAPYPVNVRLANNKEKAVFQQHLVMISHVNPQSSTFGKRLLDFYNALPSDLCAKFFKASAALLDSAFYEIIYEKQPFEIDLDAWGYGRFLICCIGFEGESIALLCYRSLGDYLLFLANKGMDETIISKLQSPLLNISFLPPMLAKEVTHFAKQKRLPLGREKLLPDIEILDPLCLRRPPTPEELEQLTAIAEAVTFLAEHHQDDFDKHTPPQSLTVNIKSQAFPKRPPILARIPAPSLLSKTDEDLSPKHPPQKGSFDA